MSDGCSRPPASTHRALGAIRPADRSPGDNRSEDRVSQEESHCGALFPARPPAQWGQDQNRSPPPWAVGALEATNSPLLVSTSDCEIGHAEKWIARREERFSADRTKPERMLGAIQAGQGKTKGTPRWRPLRVERRSSGKSGLLKRDREKLVPVQFRRQGIVLGTHAQQLSLEFVDAPLHPSHFVQHARVRTADVSEERFCHRGVLHAERPASNRQIHPQSF